MTLLSNIFAQKPIQLDLRIYRSLFDAVHSITHGDSVLSLTSMGRESALFSNCKEKHSIKRVDRLLGNLRLHQSRPQFYQAILSMFCHNSNPLIHVDWSTVYNYDFVMLRAAISIDKRAITVYEEVHPEHKMGNHQVHKNFLKNLATLLPEGIIPIICTDAGFKVPWFKEVESFGWYWLARTRGTVKCQIENKADWLYVNEYHVLATGKATELADLRLSKSQKHACRGVLIKKKNKGRHNHNRQGQTTLCNSNKQHAKSAREPWFLISNLPGQYKPHELVNMYRRRMSIEESFRDCKNEYYGLGLSRSKSRCVERLQAILLIALLAQIYLYCVGKAAENKRYHWDFQANTVRARRVLSYAFLALRIIKYQRYTISDKEIHSALNELIQEALWN